MEPAAPRQIVLNDLAGSLRITAETPETTEDGQHRRRKDMILFVAAVIAVLGLAFVLMWVAFASRTATDQQRQWGWAGLLTIISGFVGFLVGKRG